MKDPIQRASLLAAVLIGLGVLVVGVLPDLLFEDFGELAALHVSASLLTAALGYLLILRLLRTRERARATAAVLESDLRSREQLLVENLQQRRLLETILAADPNGIAVVAGLDLHYRLVNAAYRSLMPYPELDPLGRPYTEIWGNEECVPPAALVRQVAETGVAVDLDAEECRYCRGQLSFFGLHLRRLEWEGGQAVLIVLQDETEAETARRRADEVGNEARRQAGELAVIFEAMTEGVMVFDRDGTPVRANSRAARLLGASLGRPDWGLVVRELKMRRADGEPLAPDELPSARVLRGEAPCIDRFAVVDPDGHELTIQASAAPLFTDGRISGAVAVWHDVTDLERAEVQARERARQLAVLEERQHLSRELHDSVSQALYGIALGSQTALTLIDSDRAGTLEALEYVVSLTQLALTEMRAVIFKLRPEALEKEGLVAGVVRQTAAIRARHQLAVKEEFCAEPNVALKIKEALYWVAQEALNNAVKHAQATEICITLRDCHDRLELEIKDDGVGFDPVQTFPGHLGLESMRERVDERGGSLQIDSVPGCGTRVLVLIPSQPMR